MRKQTHHAHILLFSLPEETSDEILNVMESEIRSFEAMGEASLWRDDRLAPTSGGTLRK